MEPQKKEEQTFTQKVSSLLGIPVKIILASSLMILNIFSARAQQHQLLKILKQAKDTRSISQEAKEELFNFYQVFKSSQSVLCPIMIREYKPSSEEQQYKSGLLINGEYQWSRAMGAMRKHLKIEEGVSVSFFAGSHLIGSGSVINFYQKHKSEDEVLYVQYVRLQSYG